MLIQLFALMSLFDRGNPASPAYRPSPDCTIVNKMPGENAFSIESTGLSTGMAKVPDQHRIIKDAAPLRTAGASGLTFSIHVIPCALRHAVVLCRHGIHAVGTVAAPDGCKSDRSRVCAAAFHAAARPG
jgi:hypothetical protein